MKGSGGLGFTLSGGANTVGGCFVRDIVGGPAKEDGRLQQGDQILMVRKLFKCSKGLFLQTNKREQVSKETVVLRRWEYYKLIWFYQLS